jgi:hypothetical protein
MIYVLLAMGIFTGLCLVALGFLDPIIRKKNNKFSRWWNRNVIQEVPDDLDI